MFVATENPRVRDYVTRIADTVVAGGGYVHPDLVVNHSGSSLWITVPRAADPYAEEAPADEPRPDGPPALIVPAELHVPVTDLEWDDTADHLAYTADTAHLSDAQRTILDAMVDLFNECDKVGSIAPNHPQIALHRDPELLALVQRARPKWRPEERDLSRVQLVIRSRLRNEMSEGDEGPVGYFMPMIDMLNHHPYGSRYEHTDDGSWLIRVHHPDDSEQVFVRYNRADAFGVALHLGYFEGATRIVSSAACTVDLPPIGRVRVAGISMTSRPRSAPRLKRTDGGLELSGLVLDPGGLERVRVLLGMPLRALLPDRPEAAEGLADTLLRQVVDANRQYFADLAELCADAEPGSQRALLAAVAAHQGQILAQVAERLADRPTTISVS